MHEGTSKLNNSSHQIVRARAWTHCRQFPSRVHQMNFRAPRAICPVNIPRFKDISQPSQWKAVSCRALRAEKDTQLNATALY